MIIGDKGQQEQNILVLIMSKKRICAIDVGITNLGFCILEKNEEKFEIIKW